MRRTTGYSAACLLLGGFLTSAAPADPSPRQEQGQARAQGRSVHQAQMRELEDTKGAPSEDLAEALRLEAAATTARSGAASAARHRIDDEFIVFGYLQSESQVFHQRWHALTHVGSRFVGFDSQGNLTGTSAFTQRSSYLKAGGAAEAAGVKVVLVLANFDDGAGGSIASVMTNASRRTRLVGQLVAALAADSYSHGISIDVEFSWGPAVRDGLTAFMAQLRTGLDGLGPGYELSIYTNAIYSSNQWDFDASTGITPSIDYMLYSMYDWASGSTAKAISDFDNCLGSSRMHAYLNDGLPPEKLVPVVSAYSRSWSNVSVYGASGSNATSSGFTDGLFDVTLNASIGAPAQNYVTGDEAAWYSWTSGSPRVRTFEGLEGMEYKLRHALSLQDPSGRWSGRRLGGIGFWSLMWMAELSSVDPRTGGSVARTRTYPHVYELTQEIFSSPGTRRFTMEAFSGLDFRWRDPNDSPDTAGDTDGDSARVLAPSPSGAGNALRVTYDLEASTGGRAIIAHEVLASPLVPSAPDTNAVLGRVSAFVELCARIWVPEARPGDVVRLLAVDGSTQLEASPPHALDRAGWHEVRWNLTDPLAIQAFPTSEPAFFSGNSILNTAGLGARDIGFFGLSIESDSSGRGEIFLDEIGYETVDPGGRAYRINEFRYGGDSGEFVEIHGPAGPLPPGLSLRSYRASNGSVAAQFPLTGSIVDSGNGYGFFVLADPSVQGASSTAGFSDASSDLSDASPSCLQLMDAFSLHVYDNVVYEAFGGLGDLIRKETLGVTSRGWPWLGEAAGGTSPSGSAYTLGRFPDGRDTLQNAQDFSFQGATPGAPNGDRLVLPRTLDFETDVKESFTTFDRPLRASPSAAGLPPSPSGGSAWRCVDASGGGQMGVVGDAALGSTGGFRVSGELYVPAFTAAPQAIAVGVCGSQGSRFFPGTRRPVSPATRAATGSCTRTVPASGLNDGRIDHGRTWELVHASHDQMDSEPVVILESLPNFLLGVVEGDWASFRFTVQPLSQPGSSSWSKSTERCSTEDRFRRTVPGAAPFRWAFGRTTPVPPQRMRARGWTTSASKAWARGIRGG